MYIGKSISSSLSKFVLYKIVSSLGLVSMSDVLRSIFRVYQPLAHNFLKGFTPKIFH